MKTVSSAMSTARLSRSASEYTTTVLIPMRRAVRIMRTATSPRLAIRILSNIGALLAGEWLKLQPMNRRETLLGAAALAAGGPAGSQPQAPTFPMRRGVNLGNALEAPNEGDWGYKIETDHLSAIAAAGFDGIRIPVKWDGAEAQGVGNLPLGLMPRVIDVCT